MSAPALVPYVRLAPPYQPPYDDELPPPALSAGSQQLPFEPIVQRSPDDGAVASVFPLRRRLPDPAPWARQFVQAALEALNGRRPASQLQRMASPGVLAGVARVGARAAAAGAQPVIVVRSVHVSEPADAVAEVCAVISRQEGGQTRFRAVAARLEGYSGHWRCVTLQVG
ncbi:MAG: hypothetical protein H0T66_18685 [Geodermatophilaceae bacterium]|nr:hypothetical protein [Geodermatophilaceae bacterium]MDQ3456560.1 Rv3235 family protein [Actinomycetota bacterium]